jgi:hypothetical protein
LETLARQVWKIAHEFEKEGKLGANCPTLSGKFTPCPEAGAYRNVWASIAGLTAHCIAAQNIALFTITSTRKNESDREKIGNTATPNYRRPLLVICQ